MFNHSTRNLPLIFLFAGTLFISAGLMFILQPMFGKLLLPLLGGSPAVWNTCMVFYQMVLFLGYLYAHFLSAKLAPPRQAQVHAALLIISLLALPVALPENSQPPAESNPVFWLIGMLSLAIGLPFFVISTTSTLLQKWFSQLGHHSSQDPYYLYAASNAGSLLALLSYPFVIEPGIGLTAQKSLWTGGYILLCALILGCAFLLWRSHQLEPEQQVDNAEMALLNWTTQLHWGLLAFVPSSLLLGLTNFISTDIAAVPLLWIIPLTLYLLSFVLVFSTWADKIHPLMLVLQPVVLLPFIAYSFINPAVLPYWLDLALHSLAFFLSIMVCHGELAKRRPPTIYLTRFYLIMSFTGMLGGMFNTFVAPFIFSGVYEYPIMIAAALLLRPNSNLKYTEQEEVKLMDFVPQPVLQIFKQVWFPILLFVSGLIIYINVESLADYLDTIGGGLILLAGLTYSFRQQPLGLGLLVGCILFFTFGLHGLLSNTLWQERSFFGVLSVRESVLEDENGRPEKYYEMYHGTTKHGAQRLASELRNIPLMYYSRPGPMGQLFKEFDNQNANWTVGAVGLGAGALVCYSKPSQAWTMYEIDPLVVKVAKNSQYFHYLELCGNTTTMKVGDARLSLAAEPEQKFDLLMMDAFSSDAVPTHLLTQEALALYFSKLKPNGILAFHITNRHLALKKVLAVHAMQLKLDALIQEFVPQNPQPLVVATDWIVLAKNPAVLEPLHNSRLGHWEKLPLIFDLPAWTDDYTNIIAIWK